MKTISGFKNFDVKYSFSEQDPFARLKVKLKDEIVTIGDASIEPKKNGGKYVQPEDGHDFSSSDEL